MTQLQNHGAYGRIIEEVLQVSNINSLMYSTSPPVCLSTCRSTCLYVCLSACLPAYPSYRSVYLSVCLLVYLPINNTGLSTCLSAHVLRPLYQLCNIWLRLFWRRRSCRSCRLRTAAAQQRAGRRIDAPRERTLRRPACRYRAAAAARSILMRMMSAFQDLGTRPSR